MCYYVHHAGPVSGRISGPKSAVFPGPQPGIEGMFRVGKTKVQTAAKKVEARLGADIFLTKRRGRCERT
jgi:hypothetical protein